MVTWSSTPLSLGRSQKPAQGQPGLYLTVDSDWKPPIYPPAQLNSVPERYPWTPFIYPEAMQESITENLHSTAKNPTTPSTMIQTTQRFLNQALKRCIYNHLNGL